MKKLLWLLILLFYVDVGFAQYINRYSETRNGGLTFTGNTLGLSKATNSSVNPGTRGSIGAFTSTNTALQQGNYPPGTTNNYTLNSSAATLNIPTGAVVRHAELIWGGHYSSLNLANNTVVTLRSPSGATTNLAPLAATAQQTTGNFYVRSNDVTAFVAANGGGQYELSGVYALVTRRDNNSNTAGWVLAVAYELPSLPRRNLTIFVGAERGGSAAANVSGFCTAPTGAVSGRLLVSAMEGDSNISGDTMRFGPNAILNNGNRLSGPNNLLTNFFASQINNDAGTLNTSGTFGNLNHSPGSNQSGRRQGWDITNVDVSNQLANNQTQAFAQGTTTGDQYVISALGLQIDVNAPIFDVSAVKNVDKTDSFVGDTLTYSVTIENSGTADANNVFFSDNLPAGLSFIPGTVTLDGVSQPSFNPETGFNIGDVALGGGSSVVTFQASVDTTPAAPSPASYANQATWDYEYVPCAGDPPIADTVTTNTAVTNVPRIELQKVVDNSGPVNLGEELTYTVTISNTGLSNSVDTQLSDIIPTGSTYVANSTTLNGNAVADVSGNFPYSTATDVNSASGGSGVIVAGESASVQFRVTSAAGSGGTITNVATVDPDSRDTLANLTDDAQTSVKQVELAVTKDDGNTTFTPGTDVTYSVVVTNTSSSEADQVNIADTAPSGTSITNWTCTASGGVACPNAAGTGDINETVTSFPGNNAQLTYSVTVSVPPAYSDSNLINTATITTISDDTNTANNQSSDDNSLQLSADISVNKDDGLANFVPGGSGSYTITVNNAGPSNVSGIMVSDTLPNGVTLSGSWSCVATTGSSCPTNGGANGDSVLSLDADLLANGQITITVPVAYSANPVDYQ